MREPDAIIKRIERLLLSLGITGTEAPGVLQIELGTIGIEARCWHATYKSYSDRGLYEGCCTRQSHASHILPTVPRHALSYR